MISHGDPEPLNPDDLASIEAWGHAGQPGFDLAAQVRQTLELQYLESHQRIKAAVEASLLRDHDAA